MEKQVLAAADIGKDRAGRAAFLVESRRWSQSRIGNIILGLLLPIALLSVINVLCFYRSFAGYFAADDFVHIAYLANVFHGHPELLLQNFVGNWMHTAGTLFYRPLISLTLASDYLLGGGNAVVFHVTNVLFQTGSTIFLFLLVRRMAWQWAPETARIVAFFSAALFAACPLHCEVVSWIIGRVDSLCTMFYLAAFWLFLKARQDRSAPSMAASLVAFCLSLVSKEMAVTLPPAATLFLLTTPLMQGERSTFKQGLINSLRSTWPLWVAVCLYLVIRTAALGTFTGGYSGSVGDSLTNSLWHRFFGDGSLLRVAYPFNAEIFSPHDWMRKCLSVLYVLVGILALFRLFYLKYESGLTRLIAFAAGWFVLTLIPTYQVFNIAPTLQCSRFAYLGTAPLCLFLAALIFPMSKARRPMSFVCIGAATALLATFVVGGIIATQKNNIPWVHAADQVRAFRSAVEAELAELPPQKQLVIMNAPERLQGAHMIYNGSMLDVLLSPPLSKTNLSARVVSFEPPMWGEPDMINAARLRRLLAQPNAFEFCRWDMKRIKLIPVDFPETGSATESSTSLQFGKDELTAAVAEGKANAAEAASLTLLSPELNVRADKIDFVDVTVSCKPNAAAAPRTRTPIAAIVLSWRAANQPSFPAEQKLVLPMVPNGVARTYRFDVSEHKTWLMAGTIDRIALDFPFTTRNDIDIQAVSIASGEKEIPLLKPAENTWRAGNDGTYFPLPVDATTGSPLTAVSFDLDASQIPTATSLRLELSPPNNWFEHASGTLRDTTAGSAPLGSAGSLAVLAPAVRSDLKTAQPSAPVLKYYNLNATHGTINIPITDFPSSAYYEVRAFALNETGSIIGSASDPVNLQLQALPASSVRK